MSERRRRWWHPDPIGLATVAVLFLVWVVGARRMASAIILPGPIAVLAAVAAEVRAPQFWTAVAATLLRGMIALGVAMALGIPLGIAAGRRDRWERALRPVAVAMRSVPFISIILLAVIWLESSSVPVFVALLMTLPLVYDSTRSGVASIDAHLAEMVHLFRVNAWRRVLDVWLPGARRAIQGGVQTASGITWKVIVAAEVISVPRAGIGSRMGEARLFLETERVLAWTLVLIGVSALADRLIVVLARMRRRPTAVRWRSSADSARSTVVHTPGDTVGGHVPDASGLATTDLTPQIALISHLTFSWPGATTPLFADFSLSVDPASVVVILGASGSGKTTLLRLIGGCERHIVTERSGDTAAALSGDPIPARTLRPSMAFQQPALLPWRSVNENLALTGGSAPCARDGLAAVDLGEVGQHLPPELSGGMQQRAALVRALCAPHEILLLDEPLSAVDEEQRHRLATWLRTVRTQTQTPTLIASHDIATALQLADRIIVLTDTPVRIALDVTRDNGVWRDTAGVAVAIREALGAEMNR